MQTLQTSSRSPVFHEPGPPAHAPRRPPPHGRGIVSTRQLTCSGFTSAQIRVLVRQGAIVPVHEGVYRTAETFLSTRRQLLAACLAVGGVVGASHRAGLWLWDLHDASPPVELTVMANGRPIPSGSLVHVRAGLKAEHLVVHRGVPVTTPARTLADVGGVVEPATLATAVDKAVYLRLVTFAELAGICEETAGHANLGVETLREVLAHPIPRP